ncbi:MAG: DUF4197 domain-containing protein [Hyphomonadaceae bacterium]|nr:MAG: hypothetical protein FD160_3527 [Caulobacteraceae bacterium]MBT9446747.1 DUF4197 domain-containing protein [Hyphomonadaceae bacterium]TPW05601.1 MAG: hypothetical protein FD124_2092 [Alphaproteobacteria bacterium]
MRRSVMAMAVLAVFAPIFACAPAAAQQDRQSVLAGILKGISRPATGPAISQRDAAAGLREALQGSVVQVTTRLGRVDGFFRDPKVHIPLPGTLASAQRGLRPLGMAGPLDDLELKMNRAAEAAMPQAKTLFLDAVRSITFSDALSIVRGGDDAATRYLREKSQTRLAELMRPYMESALRQSGAFSALDAAVARSPINAGVAVSNLRGEIVNFAVSKALDGAFAYVAEEERAIRHDHARRTSDLLRRVFGQR